MPPPQENPWDARTSRGFLPRHRNRFSRPAANVRQTAVETITVDISERRFLPKAWWGDKPSTIASG